MTPVADQIKVPDANQSLHTISNMLGMKQQQQTIQSNNYELQKQQDTQDFFKNFDPLSHVGADGTIDIDSSLQDPNFKKAGAAKTTIMQSLLDLKNHSLQNKQALATLNGAVVGQMDTQLGALQSDGDVSADTIDPETGINAGRAKLSAFFDNFEKQSPDAARIAQIYRPMIEHVPQGKLSGALRALQLQAESAREQIDTTSPTPQFVQTKKGVQGVNANANAPMPVGTLMGKPVQNTLPPGIVVDNQGAPRVYGAGGAGLPSAGGGGAPQTPPPPNKLQPLTRPQPFAPKVDQENYNNQISSARETVTTASSVANDPMNGVQATRFRNTRILDLIPHARTGGIGSKAWNQIESILPREFQSGDAYQDLEHYTAQNSASLAKTMGVPSTNMGAQTASAAAGNVDRNPGALAEITKTNDALNTAFDLYNRGLQKVSGNGNDNSRVNSYKQAFGQALDINAMRWADAHRRGDQEEQDAIAKSVGKEGMKRINQSLRIIKSLASTGDLP